jgi:hypothetical protein
MKEWSQFLDDCKIPNANTTHCRKTDLVSIFMAACPSEDEGAKDLGFDRALLRHQWLQVRALIRCSHSSAATTHPLQPHGRLTSARRPRHRFSSSSGCRYPN